MDLLASKLLLFLLFLIGSHAEHGVLPEGPLSALVGNNVTFKTLLDRPNYVAIIWNYNNGADQVNIATASSAEVNVAETYKGRVTLNKTNGDLFLGPLKPSDSGDYSISVVLLGAPTKTQETKLRVLEPVADVAIKSNMADAIEHNSTVVLTCSAKGSFLKFTWTNGTTPIMADGKRLTLKEEDLSSTLTITDVLRSDLVGPIYCTAANDLETEKSAPFNLTVYYGPEEVTITPLNPPQFVSSSSNFNLSCSAQSDPPATFIWYHNQQMMEAGGPVLTLDVIKAHGLGKTAEEYTCRATNAKTKRVVPSAGVSFALMEPISGVKISGPTDVLIAGNSTANISCQATSGSVKSTTWHKDGKPLSANSRLSFASDMSSMMITVLQKEDNGEYTCQLSNPVNKEQASYKMVVNYGPESPTVTGEKEVEMNDPVKLTCVVDSVPPANITWKFNGTVTNVKTTTYSIEKAAFKNTGTYTCEAHNSVTGKTTSFTHSLSVKEEGALDEGLSDGAIAGIVIGVLLALGAAIGLIIYCRQKVPVESPY
uniref:carcinoembryonic antigen-related cell adhesion molecule 5-like n=1 Tax=Scatophagus argus TaxID=75038 RepID=UPI001ED80689|nr:carcinoembryonic antigen-related cell adhesion molecule 5-like [Scatophagus argus]